MVRSGRFWEFRWVLLLALQRRALPCFVLVLSLAFVAGCRSSGTNFSRIVNEPAPLPESVRANLGVVGLLPAGVSSEFTFEYPPTQGEVMMTQSAQTFTTLTDSALASTGPKEHFPTTGSREEHKPVKARRESHREGTLHDAIQDAANKDRGKDRGQHEDVKKSNRHESQPDSDFGEDLRDEVGGLVAGWLIIGAVSLVDGFVEALFTGVSKAQARECAAALRQALHDDPLQPGILTRLNKIVAKNGFERLLPIPDSAVVQTNGQSIRNLDYRSLSDLGVSNVLSIGISNQGFVPAGGLNHSLYFVAEAQVVVARVPDGAVVHAGILNYQSRSRSFTEWGKKHGKYLRAELKQAQQIFAETLLEQLFAPVTK
jgi:hypothetical protein